MNEPSHTWATYVPEASRLVAGGTSHEGPPGWRRPETTPWLLGIVVGAWFMVFCALLLVGIYALFGDLARWAGLVAILVLGLCAGWTLWELRWRAAWRWIVWGSLSGCLAGMGSAITLFVLGQ